MNRATFSLCVAASLAAGNAAAADWLANGPDGGNVYQAVAGVGKIFIATDDGPYITIDEGAYWQRLGDLPRGTPVHSIAIDPANAQNLLAAGVSLYRSVDGGAHWTIVTLSADYVLFHPSTSGDALGINNRVGLLRRSNDSGATWNTASAFTATAIAADPSTPHAFYAVDSSSRIWRSTDGGASWQQQGIFGFGPGSGGVWPDPNALVLDPVAGGWLAWTVNLQGAATVRRYVRSTDTGATTLSLDGKRASAIVADPLDGWRYWVTASPDGEPAASVLYESTDAALTWTNVGTTGVTALSGDGMAVDLLYGADARGFARSTDAGRTWTSRTRGVPNAISSAVSIRPGNPQEILAAGAGFGVALSTDGGVTWSDSNTGLTIRSIATLARAPGNPDVVYAGGLDGLFRSGDGGRTWQEIEIGSYPVNTAINFQRIEVDRNDANKLVALVVGDAALSSIDGGLNWQTVRGTDGETSFSQLPRSATGMQRVYLLSQRSVFDDYRLYRATEHGAMPAPTNTKLLATVDAYAGDDRLLIALARDDSSVGWNVYRSTDGGDSWTLRGPLSNASQALTRPKIRFSSCDANAVYALAGSAFYVSQDQGATWAEESLDIALPQRGSWASDLDAQCHGGSVTVAAATKTGGVRVREAVPTDSIFADDFEG